MLLGIRRTLPLVSAALFLGGFWWLNNSGNLPDPGWLTEKQRDYVLIAMLAGFFAFTILIDRIFLKFATWKYGVDPYSLHWSKRRRQDGFLFCPDCSSSFISLPEDRNPASPVTCGDCGWEIGRYGEIAEFIDDVRQDAFNSMGRLR